MTKEQTPGKRGRAMTAKPSVDEPVYVPRVLPRGTNSLPRDVVLLSQRSRLIEATAYSIAEKGYLDTAVADIISRAGVSRTTFYQQFKDKEDCFLFCFEQLNDRHLQEMFAALETPGPIQHRFYRAMEEYVARLADDGIYTLAFFAEAVNGGERVQESLARSKQRIIDSMIRGYKQVQGERPNLPDLPLIVFQLINEGMQAVLIKHIRDGLSSELPGLVPQLAYFMFSSLGFHDWANEALNGTILTNH